MNISHFEKCANCGACYNICPVKAIKIETRDLFYTPAVREELCINCGLCAAVCPVNNEITSNTPIVAYGGWNRKKNVVLSSSSGGAFYTIAQETLDKNGIVFGATYTSDCKSVEIHSTDEVTLADLQKSKYVESSVGNAFEKVKENLSNGRAVFFCGTPCQIAGLKNYLKNDHPLLVTCDFACGGVPSHIIYHDYLVALEKKYHSSVRKVDFRPKTHGWKRYAVLLEFENGKRYNQLGTEDPYLRSFLHGQYTIREYCSECKFANQHMSDLTIADFWKHIELSDLVNENGISLVLCNTAKGKEIFEKVTEQCVLHELDISKAAYNNVEKSTSCVKREKREKFLDIYRIAELKHALEVVAPISFKQKVKNRIARFIFRQKVRKK